MSDTEYTPNTEIPYGYCQCGCGQKTKLALTTRKSQGRIKGQPSPFLRGHTKATPPPIDRFWLKVDKSGGEDACWFWKASRNSEGYGNFRWKGRHEKAHRVAYELYYGEPPANLFVLHSCDTPSCVNPKHLFLGTNLDNCLDKEHKGRGNHPKGERSGQCKFPDALVAQARKRYWEDGLSQRATAKELGISQAQVWNIINYKQRT